jgi:ribosomal protein S18 acetylase RimI-like enzyme
MVIKPISQDHFADVRDLAAPLVSSTFNKPKHIYTGIAAYEDGEMVAYILLFPEMPRTYSIPSLATKEGHHGKGYMKALFNHLFDNIGGTYWLEVHPFNLPAVKLYESLGFEFVEGTGTYSDGINCLLGERHEQ